MRVLKTRSFDRWAKNKIDNEIIADAVREIEKGLYDANLGSGLYKKRIAAQGKGKRGGYRTIIAYKSEERVFFLHGYAKNMKSDITKDEEKGFKNLTEDYLSRTNRELDVLVKQGALIEVTYDS